MIGRTRITGKIYIGGISHTRQTAGYVDPATIPGSSKTRRKKPPYAERKGRRLRRAK